MSTYSYRYRGREIVLTPDPSLLAVRFRDGADSTLRSRILDRLGRRALDQRLELPAQSVTVTPGPSLPTNRFGMESGQRRMIEDLTREADVITAAPVFTTGGARVVTNDRICVGFHDVPAGRDALGRLGLRAIEWVDDRALVETGGDIFAAIAQLDSLQTVRFAEPAFTVLAEPIAGRAGAPGGLLTQLGDSRYAMKKVRAVEAWNIQAADPRIKVAVLDDGVDSRHPDLGPAIVAQYDVRANATRQQPNTWEAHGTCCAGLAVGASRAVAGMRGVAAGCSLLAVKAAYKTDEHAPWELNHSDASAAIRWSVDSGADVLSLSWSCGTPSTYIDEEIVRARKFGRDGKGCVVVVAAMNEGGAVPFPGDMEGVLTVSATNAEDEFKNEFSKDRERWSSNHGPSVDISAPGVGVFTTDVMGKGGYDKGSDYNNAFRGSSCSTPIVAGACALMLSAAPTLKEAEVRALITANADKVGEFTYKQGRNDYFGYGRVNVLAAVCAAQQRTATS